ncbi:MAG: dihydrodipicolinate synthase family protein [Candidatus Moraniibacteriota bacterium]
MFKGLIVPIITPRKNSQFDIESFEKLMNFLIERRVDAIFVLGTTGEFLKLSLEEKKMIISACIPFVDKVSILIGVSADTVEETEELIGVANKMKSFAVVLTPMVGQGEVAEKIELALNHSNLPILLYNNPAIQGGMNLDLDIIKKYSANPKIIGIKDSSSDSDYNNQLIEISSDNFLFFQGSESEFINSSNKKTAGLVAGSANVYPDEFKKLIENPNSEIFHKIKELKNNIKKISPNSVHNMKVLLKEMGVIKSDEIYG